MLEDMEEILTGTDEMKALYLFHKAFHQVHLFKTSLCPPVVLHACFDFCAQLLLERVFRGCAEQCVCKCLCWR